MNVSMNFIEAVRILNDIFVNKFMFFKNITTLTHRYLNPIVELCDFSYLLSFPMFDYSNHRQLLFWIATKINIIIKL